MCGFSPGMRILTVTSPFERAYARPLARPPCLTTLAYSPVSPVPSTTLPGARAGRCGLVAYARQQLRWMAAAAVCAHLQSCPVQTRLCSPHVPLSLPHDARVLTYLACAHHATRAAVHSQEGKYVIGAAQRLGCVAATEVCAYVRLHAVRTRSCLLLGSASLPHDARVLTCLACAHDPTRCTRR